MDSTIWKPESLVSFAVFMQKTYMDTFRSSHRCLRKKEQSLMHKKGLMWKTLQPSPSLAWKAPKLPWNGLARGETRLILHFREERGIC